MNSDSDLEKAVEVLRDGGVIVYPTDTLYGLGGDALSDKALEKIREIKGRDANKPMPCIASSFEMAEKYVMFDRRAMTLANKFWPGALTLVLKKREGIETGIFRTVSTVGIRIPKNPFCLSLLERLGRPIISTSANKSGEKPEKSVENILKQLGEDIFAVDQGEVHEDKPSTVVDLSSDEVRVLREGAIPTLEIEKALSL